MTTLPNRPHTALIVIDVQNGVVDGAPKRDVVVANINALVDQARAQDVPVIWVQHNDDGLPLEVAIIFTASSKTFGLFASTAQRPRASIGEV